jgi:hypothetical protein
MKTPNRVSLMLLLLLLLMINSGSGRSIKSHPLANEIKRIRFEIVTIEEKAGVRNIISSALIEGPPGTDFDINLHGERFKMSANFLTDLEENHRLKLRANLQTRRLYGYSERNLPLYEEDEQSQTLQLGFDEDVILLPFGGNGGDEKLKIEITPVMTDKLAYDASGKLRALEIKMPKVSPGGLISIQAHKIPHRFDAEVVLLEDGLEVARSTAKLLLKEKQELLLQAVSQTGAETLSNPIVVNLSVEDCIRSRPNDDAVINFDIHRLDNRNGSNRQTIGRNWSGVVRVGNDLNYNLSEYYLPDSGKKYELRFIIKIAKGEIVE